MENLICPVCSVEFEPVVQAGRSVKVYCSKTCHGRAKYARRTGQPESMFRSCRGCLADVLRPREFCTVECRTRFYSRLLKRRPNAKPFGPEPAPTPPEVRFCEFCGGERAPSRRRFCSSTCRERSRGKGYVVPPVPPAPDGARRCEVEGCEGKHLARGFCPRHYRAWTRGSAPGSRNNERARAEKWGVPWEPIDRAAVFARDGWKCHLCGELVDRLALFPDPDSPSLDHVVPMSRGGGHLWSNVATSHLGCNVRKGAGRAERSAP